MEPEPTTTGTPPLRDGSFDSTTEVQLRSEISARHNMGISSGVPVAAAPTGGDGLDADGVRQYRLALGVQARRYKRYPASALEANVGGTVEVRVMVATCGLPQEVQLARSSGNGPLDDAALDMIRQAVPRTTVPEPLRSRAFAVSLPVVFDLASE